MMWSASANGSALMNEQNKRMHAIGCCERNVWPFGSREEMNMEFEPIGIIHSPFTTTEGMPIQPTGAADVKGTIEVFADFQAGLRDLDGFSHIILLYHFHRSRGFNLTVVPFMDSEPRGLFATRAPKRPNPIGLSIVRLDRIASGVLHIRNVDILDGTPLFDIKPYVPAFDAQTEVRSGWMEKAGKTVSTRKSDDRFK
jgi:tRNA-Thr(GGU) m(6)t(6)A37 methyltransferase TsaA